MAKEYGQRPSQLLNDRLGDLAIDLEVFGVGVGIENQIEAAREQHKGNAATVVLTKLKRDAEAERRYEERKPPSG